MSGLLYTLIVELRWLEVFCRVYEEKSFSRAAERLGVTQPTVSAHVASLERELDAVLFDRLGRSIEATRSGETLYRHARRLLKDRQTMVEEIDRLHDRLQGQLELGASTIPGEYLVPSLVGRFHGEFPGIRIRVEIHDTGEVIRRVREGTLEAGFVGARMGDGDLEFQGFAEDRLVLVVPETDSWRDRDEIAPEDLYSEPFLSREPGSGTRLKFGDAMRARGLDPERLDVVAELGSTAAVKESIKAGLGVSVLSDRAVRTEVDAGLLKIVTVRGLEGLERRFYSVRHARRTSSPLCQAFLDFLAAHPVD